MITGIAFIGNPFDSESFEVCLPTVQRINMNLKNLCHLSPLLSLRKRQECHCPLYLCCCFCLLQKPSEHFYLPGSICHMLFTSPASVLRIRSICVKIPPEF